MFAALEIPLSWSELIKRTIRDALADDCFGLAAQLAYYFFLALFPALLFLLALASFFSFGDLANNILSTLRPIAPQDVLAFLQDQLRRIAQSDSGGLLTLGIIGAVWSSSSAVVAIVTSLNRAYDIEESRPWWKVRLIAVALTIGVALFIVLSFALVLVGPRLAEYLASAFGFGPAFEWTWKILQWPIAFFLVVTAIGLVYYFAPDAEQDWVWVTPGAVLATILWLIASLGFKLYAANVSDFNAAYGAVGSVIVMLLWFYLTALAILVGAELNAEIEHASPWGKAPGEKEPGQKKKLGTAAARAYEDRLKEQAGTRLQLIGRSIMPEHKDNRTIGELFAELSENVRALVQQEIQLARTELREKASSVSRPVGMIVAGGLVAYAGLLALVATLAMAIIAMGLVPWAAIFITALVAIGVSYMLVRAGMMGLRRVTLKPDQTIQTLKETAQWAKGHS
jgi:membrane protein